MRQLSFLLLGVCAAAACDSTTFDSDGGADASSDIGISGEGGSGDGGGPKDANTLPTRFCASVDASFCADFDIPGDAGAGFTPNVNSGFDLKFQDATVKSAPISLEATAPGDSGGIGVLGTVVGSFDAGAINAITLDCEIYLPKITFTSSQPLFAFTFGVLGTPQYSFGLAHENAWRIENQAGTVNQPLSTQPAPNEWAHLNLTITLGAATGTLTLTITGSVTSMTVLSNLSTLPGPGEFPAQLQLGMLTQQPANAPATTFYDNVVVRLQ